MIMAKVEKVLALLGGLERHELQRVVETVQILLSSGDCDPVVGVDFPMLDSVPCRGHLEMKIINGCGPYAYLRVWRGGRLTSTYLGKWGNGI